jgi:hypothetical protein
MATGAYVFEAELFDYPGVGARVALAPGDTLEALHQLLRDAFGWDDPHLYSFWLDGEFWGDPSTEYTAPGELEEGQRSAAVALERLELEPGRELAYVFDFGDEWRVQLTLAEIGGVDGPLPRIVELRGEAPPQYAPYDEPEIGGSE